MFFTVIEIKPDPSGTVFIGAVDIHSESMTDAMPTMRPRPMGGFSEWCVVVTWPDGKVQHVNGFSGEAHAKGWIATESAAWIVKAKQAPTWP